MSQPAKGPASADLAVTLPDEKTLLELEEKFDPEMRFRPNVAPATWLVKWLLVVVLFQVNQRLN